MKSHPEIKTNCIINLYKRGFSLPAISEKIGITNQAIWERLKKAGVNRRSHSVATKLAYERGRLKYQCGEQHHSWKGGKYKDKNGYIWIMINKKQYAEHRIIWEKYNGKLKTDWIVHHLNGIRDDNRIENLQGMPRKRHNLKLQFEPYEKRILKLENQLKIYKKGA